MRTPKIPSGVIWTIIGVVALVYFANRFQKIPPASVGVKFSAHTGLSEKLVEPRLEFVAPYQELIIYPTSMKNASYVRRSSEGARKGDDSIVVSTIEGASLPVDLTVAWHVEPQNVVLTFQNFGTSDLEEIQEDFIRYVAIYGINSVSGTRSIFDLTAKERSSFGPQVKQAIKPLLAEFGITVDEVYVGEIYPAPDIMETVKERVNKRNELELAKVNLEKSKIDATTLLTVAERDAQVNALNAQQGSVAVELRKLDLRKRALAKWNGAAPEIGDPKVPFTDIGLK